MKDERLALEKLDQNILREDRGLLLQGWCKHPHKLVESDLARQGMEFWARDGHTEPQAHHFRGMLCVDGSCFKYAMGLVCKAGWAVVEIDNEGEAVCILKGPIWHDFPQTSPCSEFVALGMACQVAKPGAEIFSDHAGVVGVSVLALSSRKRKLLSLPFGPSGGPQLLLF